MRWPMWRRAVLIGVLYADALALIVLLAVLFGFIASVAAAFAVMESPRWWLLAAIAVATGPPMIAGLRRQPKGATTLLAAAEKGGAGR